MNCATTIKVASLPSASKIAYIINGQDAIAFPLLKYGRVIQCSANMTYSISHTQILPIFNPPENFSVMCD